MSKQGFIYKYTYPNGKVYIGQTRTSVKQRHYEHMYASKHKNGRTICEVAITKYGEPQLDIIETIEVEDNEKSQLVKLLNEAEKKWIKEYDSTNRAKGYNIQCGGNVVTPEKFILEEKWYEIYTKDGWGEMLGYMRQVLDSIIEKNGDVGENGEIIDFHLKGSDLSKEERKIWYGYNFEDEIGRKTTFNAYVKTCPIGDYLSDIIDHAFDDLIEDVRQTIWKQIMKKKDKVISDFYKNDIAA